MCRMCNREIEGHNFLYLAQDAHGVARKAQRSPEKSEFSITCADLAQAAQKWTNECLPRQLCAGCAGCAHNTQM
jgi:hypothetical protein